ncbi:DUF1294 domain-containing protein [Moheibacter stercoris]|uniref:Uncharacterized membrane protein YsdA (DUF1294 family) n=1 Tax=Moheibacter stercoris TaxID=1628251 RepID=A0ABV2LRV6_9FLAO
MRYLFIILNLITFIAFAWDKHKAKNNQRRISESTLLLLTLFGGTIGAILAMILFRHKTAKTSFLLKVAAIILFQILLILYFFNTYFPNY